MSTKQLLAAIEAESSLRILDLMNKVIVSGNTCESRCNVTLHRSSGVFRCLSLTPAADFAQNPSEDLAKTVSSLTKKVAEQFWALFRQLLGATHLCFVCCVPQR